MELICEGKVTPTSAKLPVLNVRIERIMEGEEAGVENRSAMLIFALAEQKNISGGARVI